MGKRLDIWVLHKDGRELPVEIMLNPVNTGLGTSVIVGIVDIREQKAVQDTLAAALKEKTVLLYEVHHRVKNNLAIISSLLNLQSHQSQEPFVRQALDQSQQRIKTISLIHQLLYESQDVATLPFDVYLQRLVGVLANLNRDPSARICCQVEAEPLALTLSQAIPCALLVNELVTNAYKHAFPAGGSGQIAVRLQALPEHHALLVVEDNGVGMPEERWLKEGTSLGMQLIGVLAEQAHCQIARVPGPGTRIELRLHLEQGNPS
jgi:two-component sensor histidine kinase